MKRSELAHILRAACTIAEDPRILVIGSQAILGSFDDAELPSDATRSIEADIAFFDDPDERKSDAVDSGIGEASRFPRELRHLRPRRGALYRGAAQRVARPAGGFR